MDTENNSQKVLKSQQTSLRKQEIATLNADLMNVPKKIGFSLHGIPLLLNAFQLGLAFLIHSMLFSQEESTFVKKDPDTENFKTFQIEHSTLNIIIASVAYFIICGVSYQLTDLKSYFNQTKNVSELDNSYNKIKNSGVQLSFHIECYHKKKSGRKSEQRVITHKATKIIKFSECYDFSGFLKPGFAKQFEKTFAFLNYKASYDFLQKNDENVLNSMYQEFIEKNKQDVYQDSKKEYKFTECEKNTTQAYLLIGDKTQLNNLLIIASLSCLIWPVAMLIQLSMIQRYEVSIVKKVKIDESQITKSINPQI